MHLFGWFCVLSAAMALCLRVMGSPAPLSNENRGELLRQQLAKRNLRKLLLNYLEKRVHEKKEKSDKVKLSGDNGEVEKKYTYQGKFHFYKPQCGVSATHNEPCTDYKVDNFVMGMHINTDEGRLMASADDFSKRPENVHMGYDHHLKKPAPKNSGSATKRNFEKEASLWTLPINYDFVNMSKPDERKYVMEAIGIFEKETCVAFKKKEGKPANVLIFDGTPAKQSCASYVGMVYEEQTVELSLGYCDDTQTAIHEIMHALGQHHEQSRLDRRPHIRVRMEILSPRAFDNFGTENTIDLKEYNLFSTLQYQLKAGSPDDSYVMVPVDKRLNYLADLTHKTLSHSDVYEIVKAYKCDSSCASTECESPGFARTTVVNKQCHCKCPTGVKGDKCDKIDAKCGEVIELKENESKILTAEKGTDPSKYKEGVKCIYLVKGKKGTRIKATIDKLDLAYTSNDKLRVCHNFLAVSYDHISNPGVKECGKIPNAQTKQLTFFKTISDESHLMKFVFDSRPSPPADATSKIGEGYTVTVTAYKSQCSSRPCRFPAKCKDSDDLKTKICICKPGAGYSGPNCNDIEASATVACNMDGDIRGDCPFRRDPSGEKTGTRFTEAAYTRVSETKVMLAKGGKVFAIATGSGGSENKARLLSTVNFKPGKRCLKFYYFIRKVESDFKKTTLSVFYSGDGVSRQEKWKSTESKDEDWEQVVLSFPTVTALKLEFEADVGDAPSGLDEILILPTCDTPTPDACSPNPCKNSGACSKSGSSFTCTCTGGFSGKDCSTAPPSDPCSPDPCKNGGACSKSGSSFTCSCTGGFSGKDCSTAPPSDPCNPNPCKNSGACSKSGSSFTCTCTGGFSGKDCSTEPDPCSSNPCKNGGACSKVDSSSYKCTCTSGFTGNDCSEVDKCSPNPCKNNGKCSNEGGSPGFFCECASGFIGERCDKADPCAPNPCKNNGECFQSDQAPGYFCSCASGFVGDLCDKADPCHPDPCKNGGTCSEMEGASGYSCDCESGFTGDRCEKKDFCLSDPCKNGDCSSTDSDYTCACYDYDGKTYFQGKQCETGKCVDNFCWDYSDCSSDSDCNLCNNNKCTNDSAKTCSMHGECKN